jgi:hypothetical protein
MILDLLNNPLVVITLVVLLLGGLVLRFVILPRLGAPSSENSAANTNLPQQIKTRSRVLLSSLHVTSGQTKAVDDEDSNDNEAISLRVAVLLDNGPVLRFSSADNMVQVGLACLDGYQCHVNIGPADKKQEYAGTVKLAYDPENGWVQGPMPSVAEGRLQHFGGPDRPLTR